MSGERERFAVQASSAVAVPQEAQQQAVGEQAVGELWVEKPVAAEP